MKKKFTLFYPAMFISVVILFIICPKNALTFVKPAKRLSGHKQLMVVLTEGWDKLQGTLYCFDMQGGKWKLKFTNPVVVGSKGMGLGDGIISLNSPGVPIKKEGDLKSPAGFFTIGTAFGYAGKKDAAWIKDRYIKASDTLICVDDVQSPNYNRLVQSDTIKSAYNSHEDMHRRDDAYKWGLFVNHNAVNPSPGAGSCIFMHIWKDDQHGTAGCTAMQETDILKLLHWINAEKHPLLVQMPVALYKKTSKIYGLPEIN